MDKDDLIKELASALEEAREGLSVAIDLPDYTGWEPSCKQVDELYDMNYKILNAYKRTKEVCDKYKSLYY